MIYLHINKNKIQDYILIQNSTTSSSGQIAAQSWNGSIVPLTGPTVLINVWIHVAVTYSFSNGLKLYINGTQYSSASGSFTFTTNNVPMVTTLGSPLTGATCASSIIISGQYKGYMDEYQVDSREFSPTEVLAVANS